MELKIYKLSTLSNFQLKFERQNGYGWDLVKPYWKSNNWMGWYGRYDQFDSRGLSIRLKSPELLLDHMMDGSGGGLVLTGPCRAPTVKGPSSPPYAHELSSEIDNLNDIEQVDDTSATVVDEIPFSTLSASRYVWPHADIGDNPLW
ncbi:hypothetical protein L6452_41976 [Arctium lappa]|uniref:Uncharacterized protein n=1 Tax=Arctium lappa TaxID=4217 RepID=A0ACB8XGI6_ARCLA|nr:hypothetical protein L6452_41976 [Arctium lappa]